MRGAAVSRRRREVHVFANGVVDEANLRDSSDSSAAALAAPRSAVVHVGDGLGLAEGEVEAVTRELDVRQLGVNLGGSERVIRGGPIGREVPAGNQLRHRGGCPGDVLDAVQASLHGEGVALLLRGRELDARLAVDADPRRFTDEYVDERGGRPRVRLGSKALLLAVHR